MNELDLFAAAIALTDPVERAALLERECKDRPELRVRMEALLGAAAASHSPIDGPVAVFERTREFTPQPSGAEGPTTGYRGPGEQAGAVIAGKYTLGEVIGEGGMGSVWRAKQTEPVKRFVAVKLIKAGMDSRQVLARFDAERQALALMDHPNIAKVLDGGLHEHRPFFVMELVKGTPITDYCDTNKLTPRQRLELFVQACQAIQHAHQKGIIHRDIKPSNVLVALYDDKPVVKVIDFGVAKATGGTLTETTIDTGFGGVVGTPQYMSPEQATFNNIDIDTRSDVYALGVLLYELLAGSPPFSGEELKKKGFLEILRVVREEEPPRPSTKLSTADALPSLSANRGTEPKKLTGLLRNELDWIVMRALEKDRTRRYETANGFAADVLRYLAGEPVLAHPPSVGYRLRKFVRRHKGDVFAAGLVLLTLVGGIIGTTWGLIDADRARQAEEGQRKIAEAEKAKAEDREQQAIEAVKRFRDAVANNPGLKNDPSLGPLRQTLLQEPLTFFKSLRTRLEADNDASVKSLARLADASFELGLLSDQIGDKQDALAAFQETLAINQKLVEANPTDTPFQLGRASTYNAIGVLLTDTGKPEEAQQALENALAIWQRLADADPGNMLLQEKLAMTHNNIGNLFDESGTMAAALSACEAAEAIRRKLADANPAVVEYQKALATSRSNRGRLLANIGNPAEAIKALNSAREILENLVDANSKDSDIQRYLAVIHFNSALVFERTRRSAAALAAYETSRAIYQQLTKAHPTVSDYQHGLVVTNQGIALLHAEMRKPAAAQQAYQAAIVACQKLVDANPTVTDFQVELASIHHNQGILLQNTGKLDEAKKEYETALDLQEKLARAQPEAPRLASHMGAFLNDLATLEKAAARFANARERLREAVQWQQKALEINPEHPTYRQFLCNHYANLIDVCNALQDTEGATEAANRFNALHALDPSWKAMDDRLQAVVGGDPPQDNAERLKLAEHAAASKRYAQATKLFAEVLESDPEFAESHVLRFNAACTAVLAGVGKGQQAPALDDAAMAQLRAQGLRWLEEALAFFDKRLDSADNRQYSAIADALQYWRQCPDLASVRVERDLSRLPVEEQQMWRVFWAKVDTMLSGFRLGHKENSHD
jgi:serine/threonine protein kinase/tetratricopeptide (TPR) repeat protein